MPPLFQLHLPYRRKDETFVCCVQPKYRQHYPKSTQGNKQPQQQQDKQQQSDFHPPRAVRFHPHVRVLKIPHVKDFLSVSEMEDCFNTPLDYLRYKQEIATTFYFLTHQPGLVDDIHYTKRGLEGRGSDVILNCKNSNNNGYAVASSIRRRRHWKRLEVRNAVLEEQDYQRRSKQQRRSSQNLHNVKSCDQGDEERDFAASWIAAVYQQATQAALLEKQQLAKQDQLDAYRYQQQDASPKPKVQVSNNTHNDETSDISMPDTTEAKISVATTTTTIPSITIGETAMWTNNTETKEEENDNVLGSTFDDDWISSISFQVHSKINFQSKCSQGIHQSMDEEQKGSDHGPTLSASDYDEALLAELGFDDSWITDVSRPKK